MVTFFLPNSTEYIINGHQLHLQSGYFGIRSSKIWKEGQEDRPGQKCFMNKYADTFSIIG